MLIYDIGLIYAAQGKGSEALEVIKELQEISGTDMGQAHQISGTRDYAALRSRQLCADVIAVFASRVTVFTE